MEPISSPPTEILNLQSSIGSFVIPQSPIISQPIIIASAVTIPESRLHYIPIVLFLFFPTAFLLCYCIALSLGHINAFFAFISDAGTLPPETNVFAQLVNVGAALFAYFVYIRYIQVEQYLKKRYKRNSSVSNVIGLAFGFVSSLGMSLVGNFPELVEKEVHLLGAFMAFVGGSIYSLFQGYFSFKLLPHFQSKCIAYTRIFLGTLGLMLYFGAQTTIIIAFQKVKNKAKLENTADALKWQEVDGGYDYRAASVIMEWLLVAIFDCFIVTFVSEFKQFKLGEPEVKFLVNILSKADEEAANRIESRNFISSNSQMGRSRSHTEVPMDEDLMDDEMDIPPPPRSGVRSSNRI